MFQSTCEINSAKVANISIIYNVSVSEIVIQGLVRHLLRILMGISQVIVVNIFQIIK